MAIVDQPSTAMAEHRALRVCFVIDRLSRAGTESQLLLLLQQIDRSRIEPFLCLLDGYDESSLELSPCDVPVLRLGVSSLASLQAVRQAMIFRRFLKRERIDVVQTYFPDSTRFAAPLAKAAGVRAIFGSRRNIGHSMTRRDRWMARLYNRLFIDCIVANSLAARQAVIEQEGVSRDRVLVVPNLIDLDRFKHIPPWRPRPAGTARKVGMVGNLRPVKGPDLFIHAAAIVLQKYPATQFEIAGAGDQAPYQSLIDTLGLGSSVRLRGEVTNIPGFLSTLDVAVLPSRAEGLSNALIEYMAAGRPIVATDVGGNRELIESEHTGLLVGADSRELASAILRLLADESLSRRLAANAQQRAQDFHPQAAVDQLAGAYKKATNRATPGRYASPTGQSQSIALTTHGVECPL